MTLPAGERLGPYEIVGQLGAGSMGVVYRARDTRLGRDVALKVMGAAIAGDGERARRFEVEARAAGVLNHPNIVAIHDIGTHDQAPYLVSELLEGQSLRELLHDGKPLSPRKALDYGVQMALGLAAAHEKGIVHRDLKPENLFLTRDGRVKILDFGLAKLIDPVGGPARGASTIDALKLGGGTQPGTVLGTVGYMAPEQVRGQPADHRSDIFAVGAILYELLAGRRAFDGQSGVDVLSAILSEQPPPLPKGSIPPGLEQVVRRCLQKAPEDRFQSARDLAFQLETLGPAVASTMVSHALATERRSLRQKIGLALLAALALSAATWFIARSTAVSGPAAYHQLTFRRGSVETARFAPDGKAVVYAASWQGSPEQIFHTEQRSPESRPLGVPGASLLSVSSRGELAILVRRHPADAETAGTLAQAALAGGPPRELAEEVEAADWSPDGSSMAVVRRAGGRSRLEFPAGKILYQTDGAVGDPRVSRDGKQVAFIDHPRRGDESGSVALVDPGGKTRTLAGPYVRARGLAWAPSGKEIWFTAAEPGAASELRAVTLGGVARTVARVTGRLTLHDVSPAGQVLLARESARAGLVVRAPGDAAERDLAWFDASLLGDLSDDGATLLFVETGGEAAAHAVFVRKTDGSQAVRLGEGLLGKLSPDGKSVLIVPPLDRTAQLSLLPTGPGDSVSLPLGDLTPLLASWFPDGKRLLITGRQPGHAARLFWRALDSAELHPLGDEGVPIAPAAVSPDGKRLAAVDAQQRLSVFSEGTAARPITGLEPGTVPIRFSRDGGELYVFRPGQLPIQIQRVDLESGRAAPLLQLAPADPAGVTGIFAALLTADARGYAYGYRRVLSDLYLVDGLR